MFSMRIQITFVNIVMIIASSRGDQLGESRSIFLPGVSDFRKVVETKAFVDKSLLIFDIFLFKFVHITAPRRFGKSTNLNMVKLFVEIDMDENGQRKVINNTANYKLFEENNLKIFEYKDFVGKHFGKYPVVYIDFSGFKQVGDFDSVLTKFVTLVHKLFLKHKYLLNNAKLFKKTETKDLFTKYSSNNVKMSSAKEIINGLTLLTTLLKRHFNQHVFILIDDYDSHVESLLFKQNPDLDKIISFIHSIFEKVVFDNDDYVFGAVLTGELRASVMGTMSDYHQFRFLEYEDFGQRYGITDSELEILLTKTVQDVKAREKANASIVEFYKGFNIVGEDIQMYSTWSVLNYLDNLKTKTTPECYWCQDDCLQVLRFILRLKGMKRVIKTLTEGKYFWINIDKPLYKENILKLNTVLASEQTEIDNRLLKFSVNLLYHFGYLSVVKNSTQLSNEWQVSVPNKEIKVTLLKALASKEE